MLSKPYVAQTSSLFPIDLTACLFHSVLEPAAECRVFITDTFDYPESSNRRYIARAALPLSSWEFIDQSLWQQHHFPLGSIRETGMAQALAKVGQSFIQTAPSLEHCVTDRVASLLTAFASVDLPKARYRHEWAAASAQLLAVIFRQCGVRCSGIAPFAEYRDGSTAASEPVAALLDLLSRLDSGGRFHLLGGGAIELLTEEGWQAFDEIESAGENLRLSDRRSGRRLSRALRKIASDRWRFRGPAEMLLLRQFGLLLDLPWYSVGHQLDDIEEADGIEIISPLHICDPARATVAARLWPTGYSLIEYKHPEVEQYVSSALRCATIQLADLEDVFRFLRTPPPTSQRFTKSQNATRAYRNEREQTWRQELLTGQAHALAMLDFRTEPHSLKLGEQATLMRVLVTLLKEHLLGHLDLRASADLWDALRRSGLTDQRGDPSKVRLRALFEYHLEALKGLLKQHGRNFSSQGAPLDGDAPITKVLSLLRDRYKSLGDEFYAWLSFMLSGPLKAHLLSLFVLIGPKDVRAVVHDLISRRSQATLPFRLSPWESAS
jgi:hypothetical protein